MQSQTYQRHWDLLSKIPTWKFLTLKWQHVNIFLFPKNLTYSIFNWEKKRNKIGWTLHCSGCWKVQGATQCSCEPSFRWSETLCQEPGQKCCGRESCSFTNRTSAMCVSNETGIWLHCTVVCMSVHLLCVKHASSFSHSIHKGIHYFKWTGVLQVSERKRLWGI